MKMPPLDQAPLHIRALAWAAWKEWMADSRHSKGFSVTIHVADAKARVTAYNPIGHATADGESGEADFKDQR